MKGSDDFFVKLQHRLAMLQEAFVNSENNGNQAKPLLHWGQFVSVQHGNVQVGVYGSSAATVVLGLLGNNEAKVVATRALLKDYVDNNADAENQLAHNIKLAMVVLALCPGVGQVADTTTIGWLDTLLKRRATATGLWPAFTKPQASPYGLLDKGSELATAVIILLLWHVERRLTHAQHATVRRGLQVALGEAAQKLEGAYVTNIRSLDRFASTIACALLLIQGRKSKKVVLHEFRRAAADTAFTERRVFFYECLDGNAGFTRDYFIVPPAALMPLVGGGDALWPIDRAIARHAAERLLDSLEDDGLFLGGQQAASTVEQVLVGLSLVTTQDARPLQGGPIYAITSGWHYASRPTSTGRPAKLAMWTIGALWFVTVPTVVLPCFPETWMQWSTMAELAHTLARAVPEPIRAGLVLVVSTMPSSVRLFSHLMRRGT